MQKEIGEGIEEKRDHLEEEEVEEAQQQQQQQPHHQQQQQQQPQQKNAKMRTGSQNQGHQTKAKVDIPQGDKPIEKAIENGSNSSSKKKNNRGQSKNNKKH